MKIFKSILITILIILLGSFWLGYLINVGLAADLTDFSDTISHQRVAQYANHTVSFTTSSGVSAGQTISITFDSAFTITDLDHTDIDLMDDGVDYNLATTASGLTWGALFSGNVLTLTSGTATISGGSIVTIKIGTHATHQHTGDKQIRNPMSGGGYLVTVAGSFGDSGTAGVYVLTDNTVGISGIVGEETPPGPNPLPLTISDVYAINITANSAQIIWNTNRDANSIVEYGLTYNYEIGLVSDSDFVISHIISLTDLIPGTTYYFRVRSIAPDGVSASLGGFSFTTLELDELSLFFRVIPEKRLPSLGNNSTYVHLRMYEAGTNNLLIDETVLTDANGFSSDEVGLDEVNLPANYDFLIKGYSHLQRRVNNISVAGGELVDFSFQETVFDKAGDVNGLHGDNYVNGVDLSVLANHIYTADYKTDLNQDKLVNGLEFAITVTNLFEWGDF